MSEATDPTPAPADRPEGELAGDDRAGGIVLLVAIFGIALAGLVYELVAGTLSSYLLGDAVTQFSLVIGLFLTAMGVGSWLSRFVTGRLLAAFCGLEVAIGLVGGGTALVGFCVFAWTDAYVPVLLGLVALTGTLIGMEIPIVIRILRRVDSLRVTVANVMSADYVGALAAALLFPFVLLPHLGLVQAGLVMGLLNVAIAGLCLARFGRLVGPPRRLLWGVTIGAILLLSGGLVGADRLVSHLESRLYQDEVILSRTTPYQRIVVTRWRDDLRLFLDGHLQFSTVDEYRYHEALVHPAMAAGASNERVLVLGGGDGLAVREILKHDGVRRVDLVDIDPIVTELFRDHPMLSGVNGGSLRDDRVRIHHADAMRWLEGAEGTWDVVLMDLPDPSEPGLAKLYSRPFFDLLARRLAPGGVLATQATSPYRAREAFWCIAHTIEAARAGPEASDRFEVLPYHTLVPTFGTWGFVLAGRALPEPADLAIDVETRYLEESILASLFRFPPDMAEVETPTSHLDDPVVSRLYREGYHRYLE